MTTNRRRQLRAGNQHLPPLNPQTKEYLLFGANLIAWPAPFPKEQAEGAWRAYRMQVERDWAAHCARMLEGAAVRCFAARVFDNVRQVEPSGLSPRVREFVASLEATVSAATSP
ncbi:MAG: hypothetical protein WBM09_12140 [Gallionella sp.]